MIDITGVDLVEFSKKVYELSVPQGLGFLHATKDPLSDEEARVLLEAETHDSIALSMDYVHGRACKMTVHEKDGKMFIADAWYDHTNDQFNKLLDRFGINRAEQEQEHGPACNCTDCQVKA